MSKSSLSSLALFLLALIGPSHGVPLRAQTPAAGPAPFEKGDVFVSPRGNDGWSGRLPDPAPDGQDGPLLTVRAARDALRQRPPSTDRGATVWLRGGRYPMSEPLLLGPQDGGTKEHPRLYAAYPGETPVLSGGVPVGPWRVEERTLPDAHGQPRSCRVWLADLPEVKAGTRYFRSLFAGENRCERPTLPLYDLQAPLTGRPFFRMENVPSGKINASFRGPSSNNFVAAPGDFSPSLHLADIEVVALHFWVDERMPVVSFDPETRLVVSSRTSRLGLAEDEHPHWARYYEDNVFEALGQPGEWFLEREQGRLWYLPRPGETLENTVVTAPVAKALLHIEGQPETGQPVEFLAFRGLHFCHTDWQQPTGGKDANSAADGQAASATPGSIALKGVHHCAFEGCTFAHLGGYGMDIGDGCRDIEVAHCDLADLGAGGINVNGADLSAPEPRHTGDNRFTDNTIRGFGRVFHEGVGILARSCYGSTIAHNDIHDGFYSGISCGWTWGYKPNVSHDNVMEKNLIHDLGYGWLSDMGGIYTLGPQPNTRITGNLVYNVDSADYGGEGIYPDEGSSDMLIENNVCVETSSQPFQQHYGRDNLVQNNVFAWGRDGSVRLAKREDHNGFTMERNVIITRGAHAIYASGYNFKWNKIDRPEAVPFASDHNLLCASDGKPLIYADGIDAARWHELGRDVHSIEGDARTVDPALASPDTLKAARRIGFGAALDSPAATLGFRPIDLSDVGPRATTPATAGTR